jgi:hypothetical protein
MRLGGIVHESPPVEPSRELLPESAGTRARLRNRRTLVLLEGGEVELGEDGRTPCIVVNSVVLADLLEGIDEEGDEREALVVLRLRSEADR